MNDKIKAHLKAEFKEMCKCDDFAMVSAGAAVIFVVCFLGWMFLNRSFSIGMIVVSVLYGSAIGWMVLAEIIKAYGETSND